MLATLQFFTLDVRDYEKSMIDEYLIRFEMEEFIFGHFFTIYLKCLFVLNLAFVIGLYLNDYRY